MISPQHNADLPCVSTRSVEYLRYLILKGADVNMQDFHGNTALCLAAMRGWLEGVRALIETPMLERSSKITVIMLAGSKWGIVNAIAEEIVDFLMIPADPLIDSNKPVTLVYPDPCIKFTAGHAVAFGEEDESDEEEAVNEQEGKAKVPSMMALEKEQVNTSGPDECDSKSRDLLEEYDKRESKENTECLSRNKKNRRVFLRRDAPEYNETEEKFWTLEINKHWDEACEDGTPLEIARKYNHIDIVEYLSRFK